MSEQPGYQPYQQGPPPTWGAPDHPQATTILILGILGLVVCQLCSPFAWVMGARAKREIDASGGRIGGRGAVVAGYVMGIVGSAILALSVLVVVVVVVVAIVGASTSA